MVEYIFFKILQVIYCLLSPFPFFFLMLHQDKRSNANCLKLLTNFKPSKCIINTFIIVQLEISWLDISGLFFPLLLLKTMKLNYMLMSQLRFWFSRTKAENFWWSLWKKYGWIYCEPSMLWFDVLMLMGH